MKNSTILRVVFLGVIAMMGIIGMQSYWVISTWNINEDEFNKKVNYALYNVAKSLADLSNGSLPSRGIIKKRTSNYYVVNIEAEIDANHLEYFLQKEFEAQALNVDFEYSVYNCNNDMMEYGNYCSYSPDGKQRVELGNLPKYDEFTYYFGVKFPTRSGYLLGKMQLSIFLSVILFVTIIFFTYSMVVILQQQRLSKMQKDFINNMTHEFKTPISTIKISADVFLGNEKIKEDQRLSRYASIIKEQNQRLNKQVEKVLRLAKIEGERFELKREMINLESLMEPILRAAALKVEKMGGTLCYQFEATKKEIYADPLHLTNILHNLIDNAIKYCRNTPSIQVGTENNGGQLKLNINDKGLGIPKEYQTKIFQKFFRVPTGNVHNVKGFGLGLYYVKSICQAHGWKLKLDSTPGEGTNVAIFFK